LPPTRRRNPDCVGRTAAGDQERWRRPGKDDDGISAATNYHGNDQLVVFSSNTPLEAWTGNGPARGYTKYAALAALRFDGDWHAASEFCEQWLALRDRRQPIEDVIPGLVAEAERRKRKKSSEKRSSSRRHALELDRRLEQSRDKFKVRQEGA
jgi:hypothetical protein